VIGNFDGGRITSDAGGLLLREVEKRIRIIGRFAKCFTDYRQAARIEHSVEELVAQRVYALALGYEDLNDHDTLRHDPLLALVCDKVDPFGHQRAREQDQGKGLAGKSTLNRLELTGREASHASRYKKITIDHESVDELLVDVFLDSYRRPPKRIVLDADATDDPVHGAQEGRFFHGYYGHYCYLPLYIFCGHHLLCARLREANIDACAGTVEELQRIVAQIRKRWPKVQIVLRGDSGFCREHIMRWCEQHQVDYVLGLAKNERLIHRIEAEQAQAHAQFQASGQAARVYKDFLYQTRDSWSRRRRVIGKAEHLSKGANPRFIVTSLKDKSASSLYEDMYCSRGDMENRIKEQQLSLFADRTSCTQMRANQTRLYFSSIAYVLMHALRRLGLKHTDLANAQCDTIRLRLLKLGAQIRGTVRKLWISFSQSAPSQFLFEQVYNNLQHIPLRC